MSAVERVRSLVRPLLAAEGLDLYDVQFEGGRLKVTVESADGVDLDRLAAVNRTISHALDEADPVSGSYTLEVSSPGLERRLRRPEHFVGAVGSRVAVKTVPGTEGDRRLTGVLRTAGDETVTIALDEPTPTDDETAAAERSLRYDEIASARTLFDWGPDARAAS